MTNVPPEDLKAENLSAEFAMLAEIFHSEKTGDLIKNYMTLVGRLERYGMPPCTASKAQDVLVDTGFITYDIPPRIGEPFKRIAEFIYTESKWPPKKWVGPSKQSG